MDGVLLPRTLNFLERCAYAIVWPRPPLGVGQVPTWHGHPIIAQLNGAFIDSVWGYLRRGEALDNEGGTTMQFFTYRIPCATPINMLIPYAVQLWIVCAIQVQIMRPDDVIQG